MFGVQYILIFAHFFRISEELSDSVRAVFTNAGTQSGFELDLREEKKNKSNVLCLKQYYLNKKQDVYICVTLFVCCYMVWLNVDFGLLTGKLKTFSICSLSMGLSIVL